MAAPAPPAPPSAAAADSWIEQPTYIFVDIFEYEMELEKRRRIEDFCIQFFKDYEMSYDGCGGTTKNFLVYICKELGREQKIHAAVTRDTFKHVTMKNFNRSFQDMCTELFKDGGDTVKDEYVISLLAFCIELGDYMKAAHHTWYTPKLLIIALINALEKAHFDPRTFNSEKDLISRILTPFIVIVPSLLFFYVVLR